MSAASVSRLSAFGRFLRTPTLRRSIIGLLTAALVLLLVVNLTTLFMIRRTAEFNDTVDQSQRVRLLARDVLIRLIDAETGQRGFLLTGRERFLQVNEQARRELPAALAELEAEAGDDLELKPRVERVIALSRDRQAAMDETIDMARTGRIGEAVQLVRSGRGKALTDTLRAEITALDDIESARLEARARQSERSAFATVMINAVAVVLILLLAGISLMLIKRYVADLRQAGEALDRTNAGLEETVRERTAAIVRANEEIQRFAYIVSHDLRAPLVNVMGYTAELEQAGQVADRQVARIEEARPDLLEPGVVSAVREDIPEAVGFIRASTVKMDRLINAILKLSREGRRHLAPEILNMTQLVQGVADTIRHQTGVAKAELRVEPLPDLESDRLSQEQIFSNLIDNAVKYLDPARPGRVTVTGRDAPGGWVEFEVADNGRGVSARDHERIFELFRRAGRQDRPGEGVGLAFVRNSVRRLGGSVEVESEPGQGSTFRLKFPKRLVLAEIGDIL